MSLYLLKMPGGIEGPDERAGAAELVALGPVEGCQEELPGAGREVEIMDQRADHETVVYVVACSGGEGQVLYAIGVPKAEEESGF